MERRPLSSSNILSAGYEPTTLTLEVEFTNGHIYQYFDVPQHIYDALIETESPGHFLNSAIKGMFRYSRL
jgi:hypothetical protein